MSHDDMWWCHVCTSAHRLRRWRRRSVPHLVRKLPAGLPHASVCGVPGPARHMPLLLQPLQLLAHACGQAGLQNHPGNDDPKRSGWAARSYQPMQRLFEGVISLRSHNSSCWEKKNWKKELNSLWCFTNLCTLSLHFTTLNTWEFDQCFISSDSEHLVE